MLFKSGGTNRLIYSKQTKISVCEQVSNNIDLTLVEDFDPFFNDGEQMKIS